MDSKLVLSYLKSFESTPLSVNFILIQLIIIAFFFSLLFSYDLRPEIRSILAAICRLHIKLFTLYGLLGTVAGMIILFYTASINLDSKWMAIGLANTIKPSLFGMICSIFTTITFYIYKRRFNDET